MKRKIRPAVERLLQNDKTINAVAICTCAIHHDIFWRRKWTNKILNALRDNIHVKRLEIIGILYGNSVNILCDLIKLNRYTKLTITQSSNGNQENFKYDDGQIKLLSEALKVNTSITTFKIHYMDLTSWGLKTLGNAIGDNNTIKKLCWKYLYDKRGYNLIYLMEGLSRNTSIDTLNLVTTIYFDEDMEALGDYLKNTTTLKHLSMSLGFPDYDYNTSLITGLQFNNSLESLSIGDSVTLFEKFEPQWINYFKNNNLKKFTYDFDLEQKTCHDIMQAIETRASLKELHLCSWISKHNISLVVRILENNKHLDYLSFGNITVSEEECKELFDAIQKTTIKRLKMSFEYFSTFPLSLFDALKHNTNIKYFGSLGFPLVEEECVDKVIELLEENKTLEEITFHIRSWKEHFDGTVYLKLLNLLHSGNYKTRIRLKCSNDREKLYQISDLVHQIPNLTIL